MVKISVSCSKGKRDKVKEVLKQAEFKHIIESQIGNQIVIKGEIPEENLENLRSSFSDIRISISS